MKKNEIERTTRHEPKVYVKMKCSMISMVCSQPTLKASNGEKSTSEQTDEVMQVNHQHRGRFCAITRPWSPMCGIHCLAFLERVAHRKTFELCNDSYELNFFDVVSPYIKLYFVCSLPYNMRM